MQLMWPKRLPHLGKTQLQLGHGAPANPNGEAEGPTLQTISALDYGGAINLLYF